MKIPNPGDKIYVYKHSKTLGFSWDYKYYSSRTDHNFKKVLVSIKSIKAIDENFYEVAFGLRGTELEPALESNLDYYKCTVSKKSIEYWFIIPAVQKRIKLPCKYCSKIK